MKWKQNEVLKWPNSIVFPWSQTKEIKNTFNLAIFIFVNKINFHIIEIRHSNTHIREEKWKKYTTAAAATVTICEAEQAKKPTMKNMNKENKANNFFIYMTQLAIRLTRIMRGLVRLVARQICVSFVFVFRAQVIFFALSALLLSNSNWQNDKFDISGT